MSGKSGTSSGQPPGPITSETLDAVFSALSHPARRRILITLHARQGQMTAGEIADRFKHAWPTTTRHLRVLEDAQLIEVRKRGRHRLYTLRSHRLAQACSWLCGWATDGSGHAQTDQRPDWTALPYATMRNAAPPTESKGDPPPT